MHARMHACRFTAMNCGTRECSGNDTRSFRSVYLELPFNNTACPHLVPGLLRQASCGFMVSVMSVRKADCLFIAVISVSIIFKISNAFKIQISHNLLKYRMSLRLFCPMSRNLGLFLRNHYNTLWII